VSAHQRSLAPSFVLLFPLFPSIASSLNKSSPHHKMNDPVRSNRACLRGVRKAWARYDALRQRREELARLNRTRLLPSIEEQEAEREYRVKVVILYATVTNHRALLAAYGCA
jgi:hypothetical protein